MKREHIEAIESARRHGVPSMVFAHQLMVRDLVDAALFELRNIKTHFGKLSEEDQQEVIDRITEQTQEVVSTAIGIISSRSVDTIPVTVVDAKFKAKAITVTAAIDAQDPNRHGLIDVAGKLCLLVLAPNDYAEGTDGIRAERDQRELPLSASDYLGRYGAQVSANETPDEPGQTTEAARQLPDELIDSIDDSDVVDATFKEFGEFTYEDAAQLLVLKAPKKGFDAAWLQSRLAIDSEKASTLLLRLLDNEVIKVETEGDSALSHTYKVTATLADVT